MPEFYTTDQIAAVYFDNRRDFKSTPKEKRSLTDWFGPFNQDDPQPLSIGSADAYLKFLGFHEKQIETFRSYVDHAVLNYLGRQNKDKATECQFNDGFYLGLRLDRKCFSLNPIAVADMRKDFIVTVNAVKKDNRNLLWAKTSAEDIDCHPAPRRGSFEIASP